MIASSLSSLRLLGALVCLVLAGCGKLAGSGEPLAKTHTAQGFIFALSREVELRFSTALQAGRLRVTNKAGSLLYEGPLATQAPLALSLAVPAKETQLIATLARPGATSVRVAIDIKNGVAAHAF